MKFRVEYQNDDGVTIAKFTYDNESPPSLPRVGEYVSIPLGETILQESSHVISGWVKYVEWLISREEQLIIVRLVPKQDETGYWNLLEYNRG